MVCYPAHGTRVLIIYASSDSPGVPAHPHSHAGPLDLALKCYPLSRRTAKFRANKRTHTVSPGHPRIEKIRNSALLRNDFSVLGYFQFYTMILRADRECPDQILCERIGWSVYSLFELVIRAIFMLRIISIGLSLYRLSSWVVVRYIHSE